MASTDPSPDRPPRGQDPAAGYHQPTPPKGAPSSAHSRPSLPTANRQAAAEPIVTVVLPAEPPQLTLDGAAALLRILLQASAQDDGASASERGGGRTSAIPVHLPGEQSRRAS